MIDLLALRSRVTGPVLGRDDPGFAEEVAGWNLTFTHSPDVAVGAASASDVAEAVRFARANGLAVRMQGRGHGSHEAVTDGVLIATRRLDAVGIDPSTRIATIGAGASWAPVIAAAAKHGLAPITGSAGTVGVVGFLLGGGLGPLVRSHGIGSDYVREFEVVTAEGEIVRASVDENPELFWALRGGKGGLGAVTQLRVELPAIPELYAGSLIYDTADIELALHAWAEYTATADPRVSTSVAILRVPDLPFAPPPLRGRTVLALRFAYPGDAATGWRLASPLREAAPVYLDLLGELPLENAASIHNDPTEPSVGWAHGRMLHSIDQEFATTLLDIVGPGVQSPFLAVEVRHLGSAAAQDVAQGSAVGGRGSEFVLSLIGAPDTAPFDAVLPQASAALVAELAPWISPELTINFVTYQAPGEHAENAWPPEIAEKLARVRAEWDPEGLFAYEV